RYRGYTGDTLVFRSTKALDETDATAYVRRRLGQDALARVSLREGTVPLMRNGRPPKLPKADDELTRELRRLIGPEQHQAELYLGHPTEELSELLLDMSFLSQEALEDSEISAIIESLRQEHEHDAQYRDLHSRYLTLMERAGPGDPAAEEAYWDLFSYMSRQLSKLVPALRITRGTTKFDSACWIAAYPTTTKRIFTGGWNRARKTAGMAPSVGPTIGTSSVMPATIPSSTGYGRPISDVSSHAARPMMKPRSNCPRSQPPNFAPI